MSAQVAVRYVVQVSPLQVARTPGGEPVPAADDAAALALAVGDKVLTAIDSRLVWVIRKVG